MLIIYWRKINKFYLKKMIVYDEDDDGKNIRGEKEYSSSGKKGNNENSSDNDKNIEIEDKPKKKSSINDLSKISSYIIEHSRGEDELKEGVKEIEVPKSSICQYMIIFEIEEQKIEQTSINILTIHAHEIAAIFFDEIYEQKYSYEDLCKENICFKIFANIEESKNAIDEMWKKNRKNNKKVFVDFKDDALRIHIKLNIFDKENEIMLNIPKKNLNEEEKIQMAPNFFRELYVKIRQIEEENLLLKEENAKLKERGLYLRPNEEKKYKSREIKSKKGKKNQEKNDVQENILPPELENDNYINQSVLVQPMNYNNEFYTSSIEGSQNFVINESMNNSINNYNIPPTRAKKLRKKRETKPSDNFF